MGDLTENWQHSRDGRAFNIQPTWSAVGSGMPLTAADVAFSLQRVVKLNRTPSFVLTQFGWNSENVGKMIRSSSESVLELSLPVAFSTTFVLLCLSATIGCVVEKARVLANQINGDFGNAWLRAARVCAR